MWKDDRQNGHGVVCGADGNVIYEGDWLNGRHADTSVSSGDEVAEITADAQESHSTKNVQDLHSLSIGSMIKTKYGMAIVQSEVDGDGMIEIEPCEWIIDDNMPKPPKMKVAEEVLRTEYFLKDTEIVINQKEWYEQHEGKKSEEESQMETEEKQGCVVS